MAIFDPMADFERLLPAFAQRRREAEHITGDAFVNIAQSGFALHEQPSRWGTEQEKFILTQRAGDYSDEGLDWYEEAAPLMASFACFALGALLGLHSRGQVSDAGFLQSQALLPAVLLEHNEAISRTV